MRPQEIVINLSYSFAAGGAQVRFLKGTEGEAKEVARCNTVGATLYEPDESEILHPVYLVNMSISSKKEAAMDWRIFLTTFGVIFLAEMGDKTQLAALTMAAQSKRPWAVFIGAALALTAVSAVGVLAGSVLGNYLPLVWIKRASAVAFIVIGVLILAGKF